MTRILPWVGIGALLVACSAETPMRPPAQPKQQPLAWSVPDSWDIDAPLPARREPDCQADNITSETIAFLREDVAIEFLVNVDDKGKVVAPEQIGSTPPKYARLLEHARKCVGLIVFVEPPKQPYQMNITVKFPARERTWPE